MAVKSNVSVKKDEQNPEPVELIAKSIIELSEGMRRINATRLTRKSLVILLNAHSKVGKADIEIILNCLTELETIFLKKKL